MAEQGMSGQGEPPQGGPHAASPPTASGLVERFPALARLGFGDQRRIPYVQQTAASDCGSACLTMILAFWGRDLRLDEVREIAGFGRDGADALSLLRAGRWFGLRGRGVESLENPTKLTRRSRSVNRARGAARPRTARSPGAPIRSYPHPTTTTSSSSPSWCRAASSPRRCSRKCARRRWCACRGRSAVSTCVKIPRARFC